MKITSAMHHLSIKTGIQVLRLNRFNPNCLKRRPVPDEGPLHDCPQEVILWTNHRVMEWLRSIDLSEYAPNLRGSGVHGGLMVGGLCISFPVLFVCFFFFTVQINDSMNCKINRYICVLYSNSV